jgi:hypothetical protein
MLEQFVEGLAVGVCIAASIISLCLLTKFMVEGVKIATRPIPMEEEEEEDSFATVPMQSCEPCSDA